MSDSDNPTTNEPFAASGEALSSVAVQANQMQALPTSADADEPAILDARQMRRRGRVFISSIVFVTLSVVGAVGAFVKTDYAALMPGSARDTGPLISIEGTESYPNDGELLFTTVKVRQGLNIWEYLWRKTDDDTVLVHEDVLLGDRTAEENRTVNLQAMVDSKSVAVAVALEQLGYDAIESDGVYLAQVIAGGAAEGILEPGDILRRVDGIELFEASDLVEVLSNKSPGDEIILDVEPMEGESEQRTVVLGAKDDDPEAAFLGVGPQTLVTFQDLDVGFEVDIDSGSVGGPSAGLAFTLGVLDDLVEEELTAGERVAVTGTMTVSGYVGPVGGVAQKAAAVRDLGVEYFIVPRSLGEETLAELVEVVDGKVEIFPVDDLDEALEVLEEIRASAGL